MRIEQFISQSEGSWRSMRSGHSIAFRQFEQITSLIRIKALDTQNRDVLKLLLNNDCNHLKATSPFLIEWESESDWEEDNSLNKNKGSSILIPIKENEEEGKMLRSTGYIESEQVISQYIFLSDGTFCIKSSYENTLVEERIWFVSSNVRCRSSVVMIKESLGILQVSFASEVRLSTKDNFDINS